MLNIQDLHAGVDNKEILKGLNLEIKPGEMHAVMGRNGSGKSTLSNVITGREGFHISKGNIEYKGQSIIEWSPEKRALAGLFMSFQYPVVMPGVNNTYFLKAALNAKLKHHGKQELDAAGFLKLIKKKVFQIRIGKIGDLPISSRSKRIIFEYLKLGMHPHKVLRSMSMD